MPPHPTFPGSLWDVPAPVVLAHRGATCAGAPENTAAAIADAVVRGYRYVETDVRASADGVPVLCHDPTLERLTGSRAAIAHLTWAQLSRTRVGRGERREPLARLEEVLSSWPTLTLNLDVKDERAVAPLARAVLAAGAGDRVCIASFSDTRRRAVLARLRAGGVQAASSAGRAGSARFLAAARAGLRGRALARVVGASCLQLPEDVARPGPLQRVQRVQGRGPGQETGQETGQGAGRRPDRVRILTERTLAAAHSAALPVHVWTVDEPAAMHRLLDAGVDGLITDQADLARAVMTARGAWPSPLARVRP